MRFKAFHILTRFVLILFVIVILHGCKRQIVFYESSTYEGFENGRLIINEIIGFTDTTVSQIRGTIIDNDNETLPFVDMEILEINKNDKVRFQSDILGDYSKYIEPGMYSIRYSVAGMDTIRIDSLNLLPGEIRQIDVSLGKAGVLIHYLIEKKK